MKKITKTGFTLAEILVALGIVGVISAMTISALTAGVQKKQLAVSLGKDVDVIETGCQKLIQYASGISTDGDFLGHYMINKALNGSDIGSAASNSISGNNLWIGTGTFFGTKALTSTEVANYKKSVTAFNNGSASPSPNDLAGSNIVVHEKSGAYFGTKGVTESASYSDPIVGYIYIDVNGASSPNKYGRDVFLYGLTDACHMIPAGTARMEAINSRLPKETDTTGCKEGSAVSNGLSCTARVVREGYKISY